MNKFLKFSYYLGRKHALDVLGVPEPDFEDEVEQQQPVEELTGDSLGPGGLGVASAEDFVSFVQEDPTQDAVEGKLDIPSTDEKAVHWGNRASLEGGDAGTRNEQMGLPRYNGA